MDASPSGLHGALTTSSFIILWFAANTVSNIGTKELFATNADSLLLSSVAFCVGALSTTPLIFAQCTNQRRIFVISRLIPSAVLHGCNTFLTFSSIQTGSVAIAYMIKVCKLKPQKRSSTKTSMQGAEPVFTALFAFLLFKHVHAPRIYFSLSIIALGVAMASYSDAAVSTHSVLAAICSNLSSTLRNLYFKDELAELGLSASTQFGIISCLAFLFAFPFLILSFAVHAGQNFRMSKMEVCWLVLAASCHCIYNFCSFQVLQRMSVLSHSVTLIVKRVFLVLSIAWYQAIPLMRGQIAGLAIANVGLASYAYQKHSEATAIDKGDGLIPPSHRKYLLLTVVMLSLGINLTAA